MNRGGRTTRALLGLAVAGALGLVGGVVPASPAHADGFCTSAPIGWVKVRSVHPQPQAGGLADPSVELALYTNGTTALFTVTNVFANGKSWFSAQAWHFSSMLSDDVITYLPAGNTWCFRRAPASDVEGWADYDLGDVRYHGEIIYPGS